MPTITRAAIRWMQDELESKDEQIAELEEELAETAEERDQLAAQLARIIADRYSDPRP